MGGDRFFKGELVCPEYCPVLGMRLDYDNSQRDESAEIDRVDNRYGYIPGNVAVISRRANRIKNNGSLEEHMKLVEWLKKYWPY